MITITGIHMALGGYAHEHIELYKWFDPNDRQAKTCDRPALVKYLNDNGKAQVAEGGRSVPVEVVNANPPYPRTRPNGIWSDNLLALPRF